MSLERCFTIDFHVGHNYCIWRHSYKNIDPKNS